MSVRVELVGQHSGAKDHVAMTGGTLGADKLVTGDAELMLERVFVPVVTIDAARGEQELRRTYAGIHSIEHALAVEYGGDIRGHIEDVVRESGRSGDGLGRRVIDVSPYVVGVEDEGGGTEVMVGFRVTGVGDGEMLGEEVVREAFRRAVEVVRQRFADGETVPFSTPEACGQYDMHSAAAGVELIDQMGEMSERETGGADVVGTGATELYVCDLRLVKPRLPGATDQRMLDVLGGHYISQAVEDRAWRYVDGGQRGTVTSGNFGCSTGEYLMVGNPRGLAEGDLLRGAHVAVAMVLRELSESAVEDALQGVAGAAASDARFALQHIVEHRPSIAEQAGVRTTG
jgi:S-ribosylhomocysteine lyase LuxS involved in autoinducer biosynthesis